MIRIQPSFWSHCFVLRCPETLKGYILEGLKKHYRDRQGDLNSFDLQLSILNPLYVHQPQARMYRWLYNRHDQVFIWDLLTARDTFKSRSVRRSLVLTVHEESQVHARIHVSTIVHH